LRHDVDGKNEVELEAGSRAAAGTHDNGTMRGELMSFLAGPQDINGRRLCFQRWLAEHGRLSDDLTGETDTLPSWVRTRSGLLNSAMSPDGSQMMYIQTDNGVVSAGSLIRVANSAIGS
jgi:hypothetical protein